MQIFHAVVHTCCWIALLSMTAFFVVVRFSPISDRLSTGGIFALLFFMAIPAAILVLSYATGRRRNQMATHPRKSHRV